MPPFVGPARRLLGALVACGAVLLHASTNADAFALQDTPPSMTPTSTSWAAYQAAHPPGVRPEGASPNAVHVSVLHINDLYELIPTGVAGGVARLGTVWKGLQELYPEHTLSLLAGDLFSPSALSTVPIASRGNTSLNGAQMVAIMNDFGLDYATLGNHETDVSAKSFTQRLAESKFPWLCINDRNEIGATYPQIGPDVISSFKPTTANLDAKPVSIGIFGATLDSNNKAYQGYENFTYTLELAQREVVSLEERGADVIIALTHLPYWHDQTLGATVPGIDIIMGGHEHMRIAIPTSAGSSQPPIYKADSNVQSAWIHDLWIDASFPRGHEQHVVIESNLIDIDATLDDDPEIAKAIDAWVQEGFDGFRAAGFQPEAHLATLTTELEGDDDVIYTEATLLTQLFNLACLEECTKYGGKYADPSTIEATLFNAGAIRIDDTIARGTAMIQYDAIRVSPYLNAVLVVEMTGAILQRTLDASTAARNDSQFLHTYPNITTTPTGVYLINGAPLDASETKWYTVGVLAFLMSGKAPYAFLKPSDQVRIVAGSLDGHTDSDVRKSFIHQIALRFPDTPTPDGPNDPSHDRRIMGLPLWAFCIVIIVIIIVVLGVALKCVRSRSRRDSLMRSSDYARRAGLEAPTVARTSNSGRGAGHFGAEHHSVNDHYAKLQPGPDASMYDDV